MSLRPFHLAIPVDNLDKARHFYGKIFNCNEGRSCEEWIDWNFFGHQLVTHLSKNEINEKDTNLVDGKKVPTRHFGIVLEWDKWHNLHDSLKQHKVNFIIEPYIRFKDEVGEQATLFLYDPFMNALEFKAFKDDSKLFAK